MKRLTAILCLLIIGTACHAQRILREVSWRDYAGKVTTAGKVMSPSQDARFPHIRIDGPSSQKATVHVFTFKDPSIRKQSYAVTGLVRYEDVQGEAYLEMWSIFPNGQRFFTKAIGSGTMAPLTGSSGWRRFVLPFNLMDSKDRPEMLEINIVFQGKGAVYLSPLSLVEPAEYAEMMGLPGQWWSPLWAARWAGALAGGFGTLGGVLGALAGLLIPRGKGRRTMLGIFAAMTAVSAVILVAGITALAVGQPVWVYAPLLLTGVIATPILGLALPTIRKRYEQIELRKMSAQDIAGSGNGR